MNKPYLSVGFVAQIALALAGCVTVGPDFEPLEPPVPDGWSLALGPGLESAATVPSAWWEVFDDPTLNRLVAEARGQNLSLQVAALRVLEARAQLGIASGLKYPQTQIASGSATYVSPSDSDLLDLLGIDDFWQYSLGATVAWEADFWGRYRRGVESADASLQASVAAYDEAVVLLTAQVVSTYAQIREIEEQVKISRDNASLQQRSYELTEVLYRNGQSAELDMQQARTLLRSTEATIPTLEASLQQARNALCVLLGRPPGYVDEVLAGGQGIPAVPAEIAVGLPADMVRRRPDVRQAEYLAMAQSAIVGLATADLYPSFQLTGTLTTSAGGPGGTNFSDLFGSGALAGTFGGNFVWPFLNYARIKNNIRVEDARLQEALLTYKDVVLQAASEAEDAIANIIGSREQGRILAEGVAAARRANALSDLRFREGFSDFQRVLDSQQRLFAQEQRYVASQANLMRSVVDLYRALGGGWEDRSGMPFIDPEIIEIMRDRTNWGALLDAYLK